MPPDFTTLAWSVVIAVAFALPGFVYYLRHALNGKPSVNLTEALQECMDQRKVEKDRNVALEDRLVNALLELKQCRDANDDYRKLNEDMRADINYMRRKAAGE